MMNVVRIVIAIALLLIDIPLGIATMAANAAHEYAAMFIFAATFALCTIGACVIFDRREKRRLDTDWPPLELSLQIFVASAAIGYVIIPSLGLAMTQAIGFVGAGGIHLIWLPDTAMTLAALLERIASPDHALALAVTVLLLFSWTVSYLVAHVVVALRPWVRRGAFRA